MCDGLVFLGRRLVPGFGLWTPTRGFDPLPLHHSFEMFEQHERQTFSQPNRRLSSLRVFDGLRRAESRFNEFVHRRP